MDAPFYLPKAEETFLSLSRPLVFFDLETTGTNPATDRIVELFAIKLYPGGQQEELHHYINPTIPITAAATAVHGITDDMVKDKPAFAELVGELATFFGDCDLAGYNIKRFDVPLLLKEFQRCKKHPINFNEIKMVDVMGIYHSKERRDLSAAVRFYCQREHTNAHSAKADVQATIDILKKQLLCYEDLEPNTSFLHNYLSAGSTVDGSGRFRRNEEGEIVFSFGQHNGKPACSQPDYLKWMINEADFMPDTKMVANRIYKHCIWEEEIRNWINTHKLTSTKELAAALYTAAKFGESIFPFSTQKENEQLTITHLIEPPVSYRFSNAEAVNIMLQLLDDILRDKNS